MSRKINIVLCPLARQDHARSARQFAHTLHRHNAICVCPEFYDLPQAYQVGILLHEFGHLGYQKGERHTEQDADNIAFYMSGVHIQRKTYRGMKNLEWVSPEDKGLALKFLRDHLK